MNIFDYNDLKNAEKNVTLYFKNVECGMWNEFDNVRNILKQDIRRILWIRY